jgi:N-dimethylarginine dimethylaminohydrolase
MSRTDTFVMSRVCCDGSHPHTDACAYRVGWAINPHMRIGASDFDTAMGEHQGLRRALEHAGAEVIELPFIHGGFDSVFSKDNAILTAMADGKRALITHPVHSVRALEQAKRSETLATLGFEVQAPPLPYLEGGDVVMLPNGSALLGHGQRSSIDAVQPLARFLDAEVTPLELADPHFFHLDTALACLRDGTVLFCREAFTQRALSTIESLAGVTHIVAIPREAALHFALNIVEVAGCVVMGGHCPDVESALTRSGLRSIVVPLTQFHLAGGSAACLVAKVHTQPPQHSRTTASGKSCVPASSSARA